MQLDQGEVLTLENSDAEIISIERHLDEGYILLRIPDKLFEIQSVNQVNTLLRWLRAARQVLTEKEAKS